MKKYSLPILIALFSLGVTVAWAQLTGLPFNGDYRESSGFGYRGDICTGCSEYHPALDYATPVGTPIVSTQTGQVTRVVRSESGYGNFVTVCGGNICTQYSHLDSSSVSVGQTINAGQQLALSGNSGAGTGAHLDYKVSVKDPDTGEYVPIDPNLAITTDLSNPDEVRRLIADSQARLNGRKITNVGEGGVGATSALSPENAANFEGALIGCDPAIMEQAENRVKALQALEIEAAKVLITQPAPVEQTTCLEQHTEVIKAVMQNVHSNVEKADNSIAVLVQQPLQKSMKQFLGFSDGDADSVSVNIAGSMSDVMNKQFNKITEGFGDALQSLDQITGGLTAPPTNCDLNEQAWLISQCVQMPSLPSLSNVIGGKLDELSGTIAEAPERLIQKVCSAANSQMDGIFGDIQDQLDKVTYDLSVPLSDAAGQINNIGDF